MLIQHIDEEHISHVDVMSQWQGCDEYCSWALGFYNWLLTPFPNDQMQASFTGYFVDKLSRNLEETKFPIYGNVFIHKSNARGVLPASHDQIKYLVEVLAWILDQKHGRAYVK